MIFGGGAMVPGGGMFTFPASFVLINPSTGNYSAAWDTITTLYDSVCVPLGMGLMLIFFMVGMIERSMQQQQLDVEQVIKMLLRLVLGLYLVENGLEIMAQIYSLGLSFARDIWELNTYEGLNEDITHAAWKIMTGEDWEGSWNFLESIVIGFPTMITLMFPYVGSTILVITLYFTIFGRLLEFYIMTCTAPIALSDFFIEGTHSNGWRFLKDYLAGALQLGMVLLIWIIFTALTASLLPATSWYLYAEDIASGAIAAPEEQTYTLDWLMFGAEYIALACAGSSAMLKSRTWAKELLGVR